MYQRQATGISDPGGINTARGGMTQAPDVITKEPFHRRDVPPVSYYLL
jgi:hypothetical protein